MLMLPVSALAEQRIGAIVFEGNEVTQESVFRLEMIIREGDPVDIGKIERSVQNIMNLGLFEWVVYRLEEDEDSGESTLVIGVRERYYFIPLPTGKINEDNEIEYGVKLRWDNVRGMNRRLDWKLLDKGPRKGYTQFSSKFSYSMPRIFQSRYQFTLLAENQLIVDEDPDFGSQLQRSDSYGFDVQKWLNEDGVSSGLFAGGGIGYSRKRISTINQPSPEDGTFDSISYSARVGVEEIEEYRYNREGRFLQYNVDFAADGGTPYSMPYFRQQIEFIRLKSFDRDWPTNFNYRLAIGQSDHDVLGDKAFALGGNTNLRGYRTGTFRGNALVRANLEYLSVLGSSPLLRKVLFFDTGDTPERLSDFRISELKSSAGFGIRWKLRQFVDLDLRLDVAYAFETDEVRFSLGTHNTF